MPHSLHVSYFALLREQRGLSAENLFTHATTPRALYDELRLKYRFTLPSERVRVAIDDTFSDWDQPLREGQRLAFIPPVAGG